MHEFTVIETNTVVKALRLIGDIYPTIYNLPTIIGPVYGAAMCDKGLALEKSMFALHVELKDFLYGTNIRYRDEFDLLIEPNKTTLDVRNELRKNSNMQPFHLQREDDDTGPLVIRRNQMGPRSRKWPPLSLNEHITLGHDIHLAFTNLWHIEDLLAESKSDRIKRRTPYLISKTKQRFSLLVGKLGGYFRNEFPPAVTICLYILDKYESPNEWCAGCCQVPKFIGLYCAECDRKSRLRAWMKTTGE